MPNPTLAVVISTGQSRNPEKRELERTVAEACDQLDGVTTLLIPHLYDLSPKGETFATLQALECDVVVITWLYDRAAHWILDRNGVRGLRGEVELKQIDDEEEESEAEDDANDAGEARVIDSRPLPERTIYCIDFRASQQSADYLAEVQRIQAQTGGRQARRTLDLETLTRFATPQNDTYVGADFSPPSPAAEKHQTLLGASGLLTINEQPGRRWYPVIDFSRCTNCMECIDFCLFGVYGVDSAETILVEQADNCRKGCPACSRVCPQNAIIFPQHKTPAIAGAPVDAGGLKIDLSKLFGAPDENADAAEVAIRERDAQLILAGREAVGDRSGLSERLSSVATPGKSDELDDLIDQLDSLDL